jgi:hypothetical protein
MGCPHSSSWNVKDWVGIESILQKFTKGRKNTLESQCIESLAVDCESFRVILAEYQKKVLTVIEKRGMSKQVIGKKTLVSIPAVYAFSLEARFMINSSSTEILPPLVTIRRL